MVDEAQRQRQYIGESPNFSRGNLDVRYPVDSAVQNAHRRPSNRQPLLNQPPMQRPQPQQRPHVNPRMRHINPRGMNKTVDPLYNLMAQQAGAFGGPQSYGGMGRPQQGMGGGLGGLRRPESFTNLDMVGRPDLAFRYSHMDPSQNAPIRGTYRRTKTGRTVADRDPRANEMDEYGYLEGAPRQRTIFSEGYMDPEDFNEMYGGVYDDAIFRTVDPNTNQIEQFPRAGIMGALPAANDWLASQQAV
jgi:hypothetical protein